MDHKYVPASGPIGAKLMILGDNPSPQDTSAGKLFVDGGGKELDRICREAGFNRNDCWVSAVSKYYVPPPEKKKKIPFHVRARNYGVNIEEQLSDLQKEINSIQPNCILALGSSALWALSGKIQIQQYRGSILHGMGRKFVPSYRPHDLLFSASPGEIKGYYNRQIMVFDFQRAFKQSQFPDLRLPQRNLQICRSSYELQQFRDLWTKRGKRRLAVDIEAGGHCLPVCMGLSFDKSHGITVPLWNCDGISTMPDSEMVQIYIILADMLDTYDIVGQNFNYDRDKILRIGFKVRNFVSDTMFKALAINPELPKGLGFNTSLYTEEPYYKDEGMYHGSLQDLFIGCARDACVTLEIDENMEVDLVEIGQKDYYYNYLMKLPDMYWDMERQGFNIDAQARDRLLYKYIEWDERLRYRLFHLVGTEVNVNSPKQVQTLLFDNFKLPRKAGTGEEELTELLNSPTAIKNEDHREVCELILEDRRVRKSISTYLMALPDYDGRMKTTFFPCLETGRSSSGQQDPPIRPTVEVIDENGKKKNKPLGIAFQTMTKHGDIGADIREMYVPDNPIYYPDIPQAECDEIFVQADSSQAEARVVWLLADDEEALTLVDKIDYHAHTAVWFFGPNPELFDYDKKKLGYEHPIRFCGKTLRHAGHLGAGKRRASISVNTDARKFKIPIQISESVAERALKIFHAKQPRIQGIFQASVIECLKRDRTLIAPVPYGIDARDGGRRTFFERWGEELFRQGFSYIPQRTVTDNTKAAGLRIRERIPGIKIVMESHDALLFCIPKYRLSTWVPIIKEEMERPIDFSRCSIPRRSLSIPCEVETGYNYKDFKKFKDIPIIAAPKQDMVLKPKSITEQFTVVSLPPDTRLDRVIYDSQMRDK